MSAGNVWEDALGYARRLVDVFGQGGAEAGSTDSTLDTVWKPAVVRSIADRKEEAEAKKASGVPEERIWVEVWGYDQDEVKKLKEMREASRDQIMGQVVTGLLEGQGGEV